MVLITIITFAFPITSFAETGVKIKSIPNEAIYAVSYSTEKQEVGKLYSLYIVKKQKGRWVKSMYLRDIELPPADKPISEKKYKYKSSKRERIEWMQERTIYRLYPCEKGNHSSVPFWRNPLV